MADGTAQKCGRVGSCHIYLLKPFTLNCLKGFFMSDSQWLILNFRLNSYIETIMNSLLPKKCAHILKTNKNEIRPVPNRCFYK